MGANHWSHVVFGADVDTVRDLLVAWMRAKGLALRDGAPITALDTARERGIRIAWKDDVVVVLGDTLQELDRQAFELRKLGRPLLDLWMHDSDIWGYQLWHERRIVSAFHSNPTYFGEREPEQGPNDVEALCRLVGRGEPEAIQRIQRKKAIMAEGLSQEFATAIGADAAATQYRYAGEVFESWPPDGWQAEHLWFREHDWDPMVGFDVGSIRFARQSMHDPTADMSDEEREAYDAELARSMKQAERVGCIMRWLFAPFQLPFRAYLWWKTRQMTREAQAMAAEAGPAAEFDWEARASVEHVDGRLRSPAHRLSVPVPEAATVGVQDRVVFGPPQVLRFHVGETCVQLNAHMPGELRQLASGVAWGGEVDAETREVGGRAVRWARVALRPAPTQDEPLPERVRLVAVVAGPLAAYTLDAMPVVDAAETVEAAMVAVLEGLRFDVEPE